MSRSEIDMFWAYSQEIVIAPDDDLFTIECFYPLFGEDKALANVAVFPDNIVFRADLVVPD